MVKFVSASEAARRLGVTDKTVRSWIASGKLDAIHLQKNLLGISQQDVERIARERRLFPSSTLQPDISELTARLERMEQELANLSEQYRMLEQRIAAKPDTEVSIASLDLELLKLRERLEQLEHRLERAEKPVEAVSSSTEATTIKEKRQYATMPVAAKGTLPDGYRGFTDFFREHGIAETTAGRGVQAASIEVKEGNWRTASGKMVKKALDSEGQSHFCQFFSGHQAFHQCSVAGCPCHTL